MNSLTKEYFLSLNTEELFKELYQLKAEKIRVACWDDVPARTHTLKVIKEEIKYIKEILYI